MYFPKIKIDPNVEWNSEVQYLSKKIKGSIFYGRDGEINI
jgi:hypothetical protein